MSRRHRHDRRVRGGALMTRCCFIQKKDEELPSKLLLSRTHHRAHIYLYTISAGNWRVIVMSRPFADTMMGKYWDSCVVPASHITECYFPTEHSSMVSLHVMRVQEMLLAGSRCQRRDAEGEGVNHQCHLIYYGIYAMWCTKWLTWKDESVIGAKVCQRGQ